MLKIINRLSRLCFLTVIFLVGACGSSKTIVTQDDSAEYRTAKSLPPLRKPQKAQNTAPSPVAEASIGSPEFVSEPSVEEPITPIVEPELNTVAPVKQTANDRPNITAAVVEVGQATKLRIDGDFDQAWAYLSENLRDSDLTVHNRNQTAGRFSIGCSKIGEVNEVKKAGRWSIFKRNKAVESEYCSLQATSNKGTTMVSVLNRSGFEVAGADAKNIFARLLNN